MNGTVDVPNTFGMRSVSVRVKTDVSVIDGATLGYFSNPISHFKWLDMNGGRVVGIELSVMLKGNRQIYSSC
jgi:hypothetical protein